MHKSLRKFRGEESQDAVRDTRPPRAGQARADCGNLRHLRACTGERRPGGQRKRTGGGGESDAQRIRWPGHALACHLAVGIEHNAFGLGAAAVQTEGISHRLFALGRILSGVREQVLASAQIADSSRERLLTAENWS